MKKKMNKIRLLVAILVVVAFLWFLVVSPMITFHNNEKLLEDAARRYFELNSSELPIGKRIKTVTLNTLYHKAFLKSDLYAPYTKKVCSVSNSWVKVKKNENGDYDYYVYLECGVLSSSIDHKGPAIKLNGNSEMTLGLNEKYTEPGVKSVSDNNDGKLNISDVVVKGKVDTSKVGTYNIDYIAFDNLSNKTVVTRTVKVVQKLNSTIKTSLNGSSNFVGEPENNYIRLSNMIFRVFGLDENNNVVVVANQDIANVNYSKLDKWLKYYYNHLNSTTQKMIVEAKYCNSQLSDTTVDTTQCSSYTGKKKVYIPSVVEVNKAVAGEENFMKTKTMSWVANTNGNKEAYVTRDIFFGDEYGKSFLSYGVNDNYGVRPMFTIKGDALITGGIGTVDDPYVFGDTKKAKGGSKVNKRFTGEYLTISGVIFRIVDVMGDGTTKIISNTSIGTFENNFVCTANAGENKIVYNPKDKKSAAYYINNSIVGYVDTSYFENHEIEVPIYKNKIIYGKEIETKKYKAVLSAPNMYEMFSAQTQSDDYESRSYWLVNSSKAERITGAIYDIGVPYNEKVSDYEELNVRVVGYLKKNTVISSGMGTFEKPYKIN